MFQIVQDYWPFLLWGEYPNGPIGGLVLTLGVAVTSLVITFPFAVLISLARTSGVRYLTVPTTVYVYVVRGLPLLTFLLWAYFMLPFLLPWRISPFWTLVGVIVCYQAAYLSEVVRGGIEALPPGQIEAARSLGMSWYVITRKIVLPQALYNVLPGIVNQFTVITKESALGSIIAVSEITFLAGRVNAFLLTEALSVYSLLAAVYFVLCFSLSMVVKALEHKIERGRGMSAERRDAADFAG
ncbi:polar amino acid transport system permease protein [Aminobacter lissarensis]|uniref:Polar amino acid transport system permease protein n=1 Tax=Aminobacter carboxidus TaxID=376165 RepID=A0A8E1WIL3_9HYPH|nr:amino acid ABC transporter permease [Aminobacter lissarensis]MBB6469113.1 polar amino acid transport system permease protein [Aminobacter lissarensis]